MESNSKEPKQFVIGPAQARELVIAAYRDGMRTWAETYKYLFNDGWRGPMDKDGFPMMRMKTQRTIKWLD
jgi:hypothetical protein